MLKVTHVEGGTLSGGSRVVLNLVRHHDRARIAPSVCAFGTGALPEMEQAVRALDAPYVEVKKTSRYGLDGLDRLVAAFRQLAPDIVVLHGFTSYSFGGPAARLARVPVVVRMEHQPEPLRWPNTWVSSATANCADSSVAVSRYLTEHLASQGVRLPHPEVIYNGVDLERFQSVRRPPFSDGTPTALMVARLDTAKDHTTLLLAMAELKRRGVGLRLRLAGSGPLEGAVRDEARRLGVADRVELLGRREDLPALYDASDVAVLSTHFEGFGLVIVEAMAAGRPVVATRVAAVPELFDDGVHGLLVPPRSPSALADALATLVADPDRARAMGASGRRHAEARFALVPAIRAFEAHLYRAAERAGLSP